MPSWLKNIVSLGRRRKGSTKQDQSNKQSQSNTKSTTSQLKGPVSDNRKTQHKSGPEKSVDETKRTPPHEELPRNTKNLNSEHPEPRDSVSVSVSSMTPGATTTAEKAPAANHTHINQRTGDIIQTTTQNGVGDIENAGSAINHNQIVFILRTSDSNGYRIYSLVEEEPRPADDKDGEKAKKAKVVNGKDSGGDDDEKQPSPFKLSVTHAQDLPDDLKREFLVERVPEHLAGVDELHVIVSTRSGLGLAAGFYEVVLKTLLEEGFGFESVGDALPGHENDEEKPASESKQGKTYQITVTKSADTVKDFARGLVSSSQRNQKQPSRTIILLSGDGGIIDLLNGLDHPSSSTSATPTLAILPLGTGNALFHSLHKPLYSPTSPSPLILSLRTLFKRGISSPLPTFRTEFSPGAKLISGQPEVLPSNDDEPKDNLLFDTSSNGKEKREEEPKPRPTITHLLGAIVFSYGFHAQLVYESDTPAYRKHGDKRFGMAAGQLLKESHLYDASLSIRRRQTSAAAAASSLETLPRDSHSTYILTTLVSNLEKTFCISPHSKPLDGQLRLVHFGFSEDQESEARGKQTMDIMMAAYADGSHIHDPEGKFRDIVGYEEVEEIKVKFNETDERWRKVCVDGTIVEVEKGGWVSVRRDGTEGGGERVKDRLKVLVDEAVVVGRG